MVQSLRQNRLIKQATTYSTWWLFSILAALAVTSALANSGKLQGVVGKVARGGETIVALLAYLIVGFGALQSAPASSSLSQSHMTLPIAAAIPLFTLSTVTLVVAGTIVLAAMMLVRFALDTLIWLSPVPFLDMLFEAVKIAFSVMFLVVYVLNPFVAAILAFLLFLPCVMVLPWAWRLLTFTFRIVIKPMVARVLPSLSAGLVEARLAKGLDHVILACRAHVLKARGFKKRQVVALFQAETPASVGSVRRSKLRRPLCRPDERLLIGRSLAWIELRVIGADERVLDRIALPRSLLSHWAQLCHMLHAQDAGEFGSMKYLVAAKTKAEDGVRAVRRLTQNERAEAQGPADRNV
jgi:hypothetical protein